LFRAKRAKAFFRRHALQGAGILGEKTKSPSQRGCMEEREARSSLIILRGETSLISPSPPLSQGEICGAGPQFSHIFAENRKNMYFIFIIAPNVRRRLAGGASVCLANDK